MTGPAHALLIDWRLSGKFAPSPFLPPFVVRGSLVVDGGFMRIMHSCISLPAPVST